MNRDQSQIQTALLAAGVAAVCAVVAGVSMATISRPQNFAARLQALDARLDLIQRMGRRAAAGAPSEVQGRCANGAAGQVQTLKDEIAASEARLDLQPATLDVRPAQTDEGGVTPVTLHIEVTGSYQGALTLLDELSKRQPTVFVDKTDLTSRTSNVTLSFSGRVFCVG